YTLGDNVENLTGTLASGQTLSGNALANAITGAAGDDTLIGGDGNDSLNGGAGADTVIGGAGNDTHTLDKLGDVVVENPGEGTDLVKTSLASYSLGSDVENLTGTLATGQALTGNDLANTITGAAGDDTLDGGAGNDTLNGGGGNDNLLGGSGNDTINGSTGNDVIDGGPGNDRLTGSGGTDTFVFHAGFGQDTVTDFAAGASSNDVIEFHDGLFADFNAVLAHATASGTSTVISVDATTSITLQHVTLASLT